MGKRKATGEPTVIVDDAVLKKAQSVAKKAIKAAKKAHDLQRQQELQNQQELQEQQELQGQLELQKQLELQQQDVNDSMDLFGLPEAASTETTASTAGKKKKKKTKTAKTVVEQLDEGLALLGQHEQQQVDHSTNLLEELILQQQLEQHQLQMEQQLQLQQQLLPRVSGSKKSKRKESKQDLDNRKKTQEVINAAVVAAAAVASAATQHAANSSATNLLSGSAFQNSDQWQQLMSENDHEILQNVFAAAAQQAVQQVNTAAANDTNSASATAAASLFLPLDTGTMLARAAAAAATSESETIPSRQKSLLLHRPSSAVIPQSAVMVPSADPINDTRILSQKYIKTLHVTGKEADALRASYNQGPFSNLERHRVDEVVEAFMLEHNIPRKDLHYLINRRTDFSSKSGLDPKTSAMYNDKKFSGFIANVREAAALNRTVDQLYWYMSRAYSNKRSGGSRWTEEEDDMLRHLISIKGERYAEIEREMGRSDIKKRWKKLLAASNETIKSGRWSEEEIQKLGEAVNHVLVRDKLPASSNLIRWRDVANMVVTRTDIQCRTKWNLSFQSGKKAVSVVRSFEYEDYASLLTRMSALCSAANDETEIVWEMLVGENEPWNAQYLKTRWSYLKGVVPVHELTMRTFSQIIDYCFDNLVELIDRRSRLISTSEFLVNTEDMEE
ncbi:hypothetical protein BDV3_000238 [Batrachochytrium dendrobatidis]|nr:hypothetical protein BDEG_21255 [Batrachochytrium dendrobatidis JEL423]